MTDSWDEVLEWERWAKEVLTDWRVPFDNHKVGLRLGITQQLRDLRDERDALAARLAEKEAAFKQLEEAADKMHESWGPLMARLADMETLNRSWMECNGPGGWINDMRERLVEAERLLNCVYEECHTEGLPLHDMIGRWLRTADSASDAAHEG
jgi:hypothetical protein